MWLRRAKPAASSAVADAAQEHSFAPADDPHAPALAKLEIAGIEQGLLALREGRYNDARGLPGHIGQSIEALADSLEAFGMETIKRTVESSWQSGETMIAIASMATDLDGVSNNAGTISSTAAEMSQTVSNIAQMGNSAAEDAAAARHETDESIGRVDTAGTAMSTISEEVRDMRERLDVLQRAVDQIADMTQTIEDISSQTNLLALNATIEAARAGEAGRGFAVVASEVKALSQQTASATEQIRDRTNALTSEMSAMMSAIQKNAESVQGAEEIVSEVSSRFHGVGEQIAGVSSRFSEMAAALDQQKGATEEISRAIGTIAEEAKRSRGTAKKIAQYSSQTGNLIGQQFAQLNRLDIHNGPLEMAKAEHMLIKKRMAEVIAGFRTLSFDKVPVSTECALAKWSMSHLHPQYRESAQHNALKDVHKRFHDTARAVLADCNEGRQAQAREKFRLLDGLLEELVAAIDRLEATAKERIA